MVGVVAEPGPRTPAAAAALRVALGRIVQVMLEVIAGRRPAGQLDALAEAWCCATCEPPGRTAAGATRSQRTAGGNAQTPGRDGTDHNRRGSEDCDDDCSERNDARRYGPGFMTFR